MISSRTRAGICDILDAMHTRTRANPCHVVLAISAVLAVFSALANGLEHRWSFDGDYADSVGGLIGMPTGSPTFSDGKLVLPGGPKGTANVELGTNVLSVGSNSVTVEIWTRQKLVLNSARLFDYYNGTGTAADKKNDIYMAFNQATNSVTTDKLEVMYDGVSRISQRNTLQPYTPDTMYHVSMVFHANGDGSTTVSWAKRNAATGAVEKGGSGTIPDFTLAAFHQKAGKPCLRLGCSLDGAPDPSAEYDEVRVWSAALPDPLLNLSAALGPDAVALAYDADGKACLTIPANGTLPVNADTLGSSYVLDGSLTLGAGAQILFDIANAPDGMSLTAEGGFNVPSGSIADYVALTAADEYEVSLEGNTLVVAPPAPMAWTGEAGDGDWFTAANWTKGVPEADEDVMILATATTLPQTPGACNSLMIAGGTLSADCDWSGIAVKPVLSGAVNLNGHNLTLPSSGIAAQAGAAFTNSVAADGEVRFYANGDPANATESAFIDGIAHLSTATNAKVVIIRSDPSSATGSLNIGAANNHTVFRAEDGTITMDGDGVVGAANSGSGYLEIAGATLDFGSVNNRGITIGANNVSARAVVTISSGKLRTNWLNSGGRKNVECRIVQSGGEVETGVSTDGNLWMGRMSGAVDSYEMTGGVINQGTAKGIGSFSVGYYNGSRSVFALTNGTINSMALQVGTDGAGTFVQSGGAVNSQGDVVLAQSAGAVGTYTLDDGTLTPSNWLYVGRSGTGTFTQNGGTAIMSAAEIAQGNWLCLAESATGNGTYVMNGGYLEAGTGAKGGGIFAGRRGTGRFELNGGTVVTPAFIDQTGHSTVLLNGGTVKVSQDGGMENSNQHSGEYGIFTDIDNLVFGDRTTTLDTDGHDTKILGCGYVTSPGGSALVKTGAGKLTVDAFPPVDSLVVSNGAIAVSVDADNSATASLAHRWSFNDDYSDSVGGSTGTVVGRSDQLSFADSPLGGRLVTMASSNTGNGTTGGASLDLGDRVWGLGDVTVEVWARQDAVRANGRIIDYGNGTENGCYMAWSNGTDETQDKLGIRKDNGDAVEKIGVLSPYALGTLYHISVSFKRNADGSTTVAWQRRSAETGAVEKGETHTQGDWTLDDLVKPHFYIGHSQWATDRDANASYDEVRVWKGVLSEAALTLSARKGPDATAADIAEIASAARAAAPAARTLRLEPGAALEIASDATFTQPILAGSGGTVSGGTLAISDKILVNVGDCTTASGTIDLSHAKVELVDPENLAKGFYFIKTAPDSTLDIVGKPEAVNLPPDWEVAITPKGAKIRKVSFTVFLR